MHWRSARSVTLLCFASCARYLTWFSLLEAASRLPTNLASNEGVF